MALVQDAYMIGKAAVAHGAASSADFVRRAFAAPLAAAGYEVVSWDRRTPVHDAAEEFASLVRDSGATVIGGVSVGAILAVHYALAAGAELTGLLVALPPAARAGPVELPAAIDVEAAARGSVPWVAAEIRAAWPGYAPDELVAELRSAASAAPPTESDLARVGVPTGVVALADDPVHPVEVAAAWAEAIPVAALDVVQMTEPAADVA